MYSSKLANAIAASHEIIEAHYPSDGIRSDSSDSSYFNGWYISDDGIIEHGGWNPTYKAQVIIDLAKETAVFTDCNSTANTQWYAMRSCFGKLTGHSEYTDIVKCDMLIIDIIASVISIAVSLIILLVLIMLLTQKKRLMKKTCSPKKEKALLCARLVLLIPLLFLSVSLPYILGAVMGYPGFGYQKVWAWGGQSAVVMGLMLDVLLILLIITSIKQYIIKRRNS